MRSKLIFLVTVIILLFALVFTINRNRASREKVRIEEKLIKDRMQAAQDSILKEVTSKNKSKSESLKQNISNTTSNNNSAKKEDFSSYINTTISKTANYTNIAVTIIDADDNISSSISSSVADVYTKSGMMGINGLLRNSFVHQSSFQKLVEGNSEIIAELKLSNHTDYLALGKIQFSIKNSNLVSGSFVCTATLTMNIISIGEKALFKSFSLNATGNGATESQAQEEAIQRLINKYSNDYSFL